MHRLLPRLSALLLAAAFSAGVALAQTYPARPIKLLVPFTPGGSQDVIGRLFAHYLTPSVARMVEAMDAERRAVAAAFGLHVTSIEEHFQRSFDVPQDELADIAAELHRRRGGPPGPTSLDTRFVLEDVPYGLAFNAALARIVGVEVPVTRATVTLLATLYDRDLAQDNPLIGALGLAEATRNSLLARCEGNGPAAAPARRPG